MGETNFSEIVRKYISDTFQRDPTYFSSKTVTERNADFKVFCDLNSSTGLNFKNHRPLLSQELTKQKDTVKLKMDGKDTKTKSEKFKTTRGKQKGNITVNPTGVQPPQTTTPQTTETTTPQTTGLQVADATQQTKAVVLHPPTCMCNECMIKRGELQPLDPEEAGGILEIIIDLWHSRNPDVELMSPEEVLRVGKRIAPILQRHIGGDILLYGMGLVVVGQVIMKRVDQSRGSKKKDKTHEKQKKANEKTSKEEPPKKESKDETDNRPPKRKFFSSKKLREIEAMGDKDDD